MKNQIFALAGVCASAAVFAGGTFYWNPTAVPGAAGDAEWSTAAAAWSESSAGTSEPVVWQDISQDWYSAVFATPGTSVVTLPGYLRVNALSFLGGTYVFPTTQELAPYGDMLVADSDVTVASGATLTLDTEMTVAALRVDMSAGAGNIFGGFIPAANGILYLDKYLLLRVS